ncbi:MAG TPA: DUF1684 domain-containing protein [Vicinamibacterales bacterium]|nr:DUF1684 domain-containing protein [Vicinamibacterales bacterium]
MRARLPLTVVLVSALAGCGRSQWPEPPPVDQAQYQKTYAEWRDGQQETAAYAIRILGIWPLQDGDTPFGADPSLPIVLPAAAAPGRAGVFRRAGEKVTVIPAPGAPLRTADGASVTGPAEIDNELALGSVHLQVIDMGKGRRFVSAADDNHPALENLPMVETYPLDARWRVAARFDAFDAPKPVRVPDVRGGVVDFFARGQLVFKVNEQELRLTALGEPESSELFVMFKDETNGSTTFGGYRLLSAAVVPNGEWTVLDFNLAGNPPCAYSSYTTCPLPPPENRLTVAIEAGEKRFPAAQELSHQ